MRNNMHRFVIGKGAAVPDEVKQDKCGNCKQAVVYQHDAWWHVAELFGTFDGACTEPLPTGWAKERALA